MMEVADDAPNTTACDGAEDAVEVLGVDVIEALQRVLDLEDVVKALSALFEKVPNVMFCVKDHEGCYVAVNPAFAARARYPYGEVEGDIIGKTARQVFGEELGSQYELQDEAIWRTGEPLPRKLEPIYRSDRIHTGYYLTTKALLGAASDPSTSRIISISVDLNEGLGSEKAHRTVRDAIDWIAANIKSRISHTDIAKGIGVTDDQLTYRFKGVLKMTPTDYVQEHRLDLAVHELRHSPEKKVTAIYLDCGYADHRALLGAVRDAFGRTPTELRAAYQREHPGLGS